MKLKIKNIGPFNDTSLNIGDITIIAGVNDTGKSYLSRLVFAMVKIATSDIKSEIIKNFGRLSKIRNKLNLYSLIINLDKK